MLEGGRVFCTLLQRRLVCSHGGLADEVHATKIQVNFNMSGNIHVDGNCWIYACGPAGGQLPLGSALEGACCIELPLPPCSYLGDAKRVAFGVTLAC